MRGTEWQVSGNLRITLTVGVPGMSSWLGGMTVAAAVTAARWPRPGTPKSERGLRVCIAGRVCVHGCMCVLLPEISDFYFENDRCDWLKL